jgi:hypothetical protein
MMDDGGGINYVNEHHTAVIHHITAEKTSETLGSCPELTWPVA